MVKSRKTVLAGLLAILLYLPWLILPAKSALSRAIGLLDTAAWGSLSWFETWLVFAAGLPVPQTLLAFILFGTVWPPHSGSGEPSAVWRMKDTSLRDGVWLLYLAIAPALLMFALSTWQPVYLERALLTSGAVFLLWLTWALSTPRLSELLAWTGRIALFGTFALGLFGFYTYRGFPYAPWTLLDEALTTDVQDQEIVLHSQQDYRSTFPITTRSS